MRRKSLLSILLVLAMVFSLAACGGSNTTDSTPASEEAANVETVEVLGTADSQEGTVVVGESTDSHISNRDDFNMAINVVLASSSPTLTTTVMGKYVMFNIYEPLVRANDDGSFTNLLAESYECSDDGLTWTFNLRQGVKFHNGSDFIADDCVATLTAYKEAGKWGADFTNIVSWEAVDDYTFQIVTDKPVAPFLIYVADFKMIDDEEYAQWGTDGGLTFETVFAGTGPYMLTAYTPDVEIAAEAFEDYYLGEAKIKKLHWDVILDDATIMAALEAGEIDFASVGTSYVESVRDNDELNLVLNPSTHMTFVKMNAVDNEILADKRVRQAVMYAINKEEIMEGAYNGLGDVAGGVARYGYVFGAIDNGGYEYNPEKAKELLAEAGYADGVDLGTLWTISTGYFPTATEILRGQLEAVGITLEVRTADATTLADAIYNRGGDHWDMTLYGDNKTLDSATFYDYFYRRDYRAAVHVGWDQDTTAHQLDNPEIQDLGEKAAVTMDRDEREAIYNEMWELCKDEARVTCVFHRYNCFACNKLLNVTLHNAEFYLYDFSWQ